MFIGRTSELTELEKLYCKGTFQMAVIYGRRRVGKTSLIKEFIKNKKAIFFTAVESSGRNNLLQLSMAILAADGTDTQNDCFASMPVFETFEDGFSRLAHMAQQEKIVLVIDEYPYLASSVKGISSVLQSYIDNQYQNENMMLILCGSSMSFMENQVLGYQSPLYGRRTAQFKLMPFDYSTAAQFLPGYTPFEKAVAYGVTGGIPKYLELMDSAATLKENIIDIFLKSNAYLFEEPSNLLKQELREPSNYNAIIEAVASGAVKMHEISQKTGFDTAVVSTYVKTLISLGLIKKEFAITDEKNKKKTLYKLEDTMFAFWYKYIPKASMLIHAGAAELVYDKLIFPTINEFMGWGFEEMCRQYLIKLNLSGSCPFLVTEMGRFWGTNPVIKKEVEIDILAINKAEKAAIFCECKFRNEKVSEAILEELKTKAAMFPQFDKKYYVLFSKNGFSDGLKTQASQNVSLVTLEDMYLTSVYEMFPSDSLPKSCHTPQKKKNA